MKAPSPVFSATSVAPFCLPGDEGTYESRLLIEQEGVGSQDLQVNRFTLFPGSSVHGEVHPANDEAYFVLHGQGEIVIGGEMPNGVGGTTYRVGPESVIFLPAGTYHRLINASSEPLVVLTIWPRQPHAGANKIAEGRRLSWGESFRLNSETP